MPDAVPLAADAAVADARLHRRPAGTVPYLPLLLPFGLLMVVGGINVSESARAAGDDYRTRDVLLAEAVSTLVAGFCGGVAQTTPYIGQPAYKHMGARSGYTLLTGLFIGLGGMLGYVSGLVQWLPVAVLAPIIVYVGLDITVQAFHETPRKHAIAVALGFLPAIAYLLDDQVRQSGVDRAGAVSPRCTNGVDGHGLPDLATIVTLGNGFIITAMIWATALVAMIDGRNGRAVRRAAGRRGADAVRHDPFGGSARRHLPAVGGGRPARDDPVAVRRGLCRAGGAAGPAVAAEDEP